jgi:hypothetical protein
MCTNCRLKLQAQGTGALIVSAMLDVLTFALCVPYSETTDGKHFDVLLEMVSDRGRMLFRLFQVKRDYKEVNICHNINICFIFTAPVDGNRKGCRLSHACPY